VLTVPHSLAAGDSSMSPPCFLPPFPTWALILTGSVVTPKREEDGDIKLGGRRDQA
jgi:hypothetical protein